MGASMVLSALAAAMLYTALEESERSVAEAWIQATAIQMARSIGEDHRGALSEVDGPDDALQMLIADALGAMAHEVDARFDEPIIERTVVELAVLVPGETAGRAIVAGSLDGARVGTEVAAGASLDFADDSGLLSSERVRPEGGGRLLYRVHAPVLGADGSVIGAVRMDSDYRYFQMIMVFALVGALIVFVVGLGISALLSVWFSRSMARPAQRLNEAMGAVAGGDLGVRLEIPGTGDEFDALARRFNEMAGGLRDRERIRREVDAGAQIQQRLLPGRSPEVEGYEIHGLVRFCEDMGGDYLDFFPVPCEHGEGLGMVVGDVSGHGIGAALLMAASQGVLLSAFYSNGNDLAGAMDAVNQQIGRRNSAGQFITAFAATLDGHAHRLEWVSAGHEPGLLVRGASGEVSRLGASGMPLGIFTPNPLSPETIELGVGDVLLVATDGVRECRSPTGEFYGLERLEGELGAMRSGSAHEIAVGLLARADAHMGSSSQIDDITLLVIKRVS